MNTELKEAEKVIDNSFEQYWNSIMDCVCNYLKLSDDNTLGLRCHVSEIEHDEFAKPIYDLIDRTPSPSGETDKDDMTKHFKKLKVTDIPENHKRYYNGYNDGIEDCIIALLAHNQFAGDGWISVRERLPEENVKVWGALQHWHTKNYRYTEIKKVKESDCDWRTCDDNSEISHDWTVTHWQPLPQPPQNQKS